MILVDFENSLNNFLNQELNQYRIVHLATHGVFNINEPALSGLVFSLIDEEGNPQPGYLRFNEIFNLNLLETELVVLSACQSGVGEDVSGEGLVGITRGFMYAGAEQLLVSLWNVNDGSTAELMKRFYRYYEQEGLTATVALQKAQEEMMNIPEYAHPYYWGAFVVQGL